MTQEEFDHYLAERYIKEIEFYENRSRRYKIYYHVFQWSVIILSAITPVLVAIVPEKGKIATIIVSIFLAIGTTALKTFKYQEIWVNYRTIAETLKKEKFYFEANVEGYLSSSDNKGVFIERVESIISRENTLWVSTYKPKSIEKKEV